MKLKRREKILLLFCLIAVSFYFFDLFYYKPRGKRIKTIEGEIKAIDNKIQELTLLTKGIETLSSKVKELEDKLRGVNEKPLKGEEFKAFLNHLAKESNPRLMRVISLKPVEEEITTDKDGERIGSKIKKISISMILYSTFQKLQGYINEIEKLPFLIHIEGLQVERDEEIYPLLKITLKINLFISPKK